MKQFGISGISGISGLFGLSGPTGQALGLLLVLGSLSLAAGCGDDIELGDSLPDIPATGNDLRMLVIPSADLAANGGSSYVGFVAYQDGDSPWELMEKEQDGLYRATLHTRTFGVAVGCVQHFIPGTNFSASLVSIHHATVADGTTLTDFSCVELLKPLTISGTATGLPAGNTFLIGTGEGSSNTTVRADGFTVGAYAEPTDVIGYYNGGTPATSKVVRLADVDPRQNTPISLDFASQGAIPVTFPVTAPASTVPIFVSAHVRNKDDARLLHLWSPSNQLDYATMPKALLREGDLVRVGITTSQPGATQDSFIYLAEPGPVSLAFGSPFGARPPTLIRDTTVRTTFTLDSATSATLAVASFKVSASTRGADSIIQQTVSMTQAWMRDTASASYQLPDLSSLPGWEGSMALQATGPVKWTVARYQQSSATYEPNHLAQVDTVFGEITE